MCLRKLWPIFSFNKEVFPMWKNHASSLCDQSEKIQIFTETEQVKQLLWKYAYMDFWVTPLKIFVLGYYLLSNFSRFYIWVFHEFWAIVSTFSPKNAIYESPHLFFSLPICKMMWPGILLGERWRKLQTNQSSMVNINCLDIYFYKYQFISCISIMGHSLGNHRTVWHQKLLLLKGGGRPPEHRFQRVLWYSKRFGFYSHVKF